MATDLSTRTDAGRTSKEQASAWRRRPYVWLAAGLAVVAIAATSVGATRSNHAGATSVGGRPAPAFDLPRLGIDGERVRLADLAGRPVVINFWASWCVPCRREMPALQAAAEKLGGRVAFVGVNHQDGRTPAAEFERKVGVAYPSGYDPDGVVALDYGLVGLPTTVLVDAAGQIVARRIGEVTEDQLLGLVADAFGVDARRRVR